jgi:translation initiation factor IF-2
MHPKADRIEESGWDENMTVNEKVVELADFVTVRELAETINESPIAVIKALMSSGVMANINQQIDFDTAAIVCEEFGYTARSLAEIAAEIKAEEEAAPSPMWETFYAQEDAANLKPRPPVATMLGHVDHGKTSLLDAIRGTDVFGGEAGGITQHVGAYQITHNGKKITFLDTPGHEAFTAMRARGAQGADIAILVIAADDGIMPQTREAIAHARAAKVPIIVALNKMDLPSANPERAKQQLAEMELVPDEWEGDTLVVPVSAKLKQGLEDLLEALLLVADEEEIVANPDRSAHGTVIEGEMDKSRGVTATLLVQNGTLNVGDTIIAGVSYGRIRAMFDFRGNRIETATPSTPVSVLGLSEVPVAGQIFEVIGSEKEARDVVAERIADQERRVTQRAGPSLEEIFAQFQAGQAKTLNLIVKADVQGTLEPIIDSLKKIEVGDLKLDIIDSHIGNVVESDVMLASASKAIVVGFQVDIDPAARRAADTEGVDIRIYQIIYKLIEDIEKALRGLLEPTYVDVEIGRAEVRAIFRLPRAGSVAGCYMRSGVARRDALVRVWRNEEQIYEGRVASLRRFQEDVREVRTGFECGVGLDHFDDFEEGDSIEFYVKERES